MKITRLQLVFLTLTFLLFAFFRFNNIQERVIFDWDQEQFSNQIKGIVENRDFTLLGPRANNDKGFFLAPYLTYLLVPFYLATGLHPSALTGFLILFNLAFFALTYFILSRLFSVWHAIAFLALWAINPILVTYDTIPWWPLFIPLGTIVIWQILSTVYKKPKLPQNWLGLGVALGFFFNMHFQFIFLILFSKIFIFLRIIQEKKLYIYKVFGVLGFLLTLTPLLIFDMRNNFLNSRLFIDFFKPGSEQLDKDPNVWREVFAIFLTPITTSREPWIAMTFYFAILLGTAFLMARKEKFQKVFYQATLGLWVLFPIFFIIFGKRPSEYYFVFLYPFIYIVIIDLLMTLKAGLVIPLAAFALLALNATWLQETMRSNPGGLAAKERVVKIIEEKFGGKKFHVSYDGPPNTDTGFRYLMDNAKIKQSKDLTDPLVQVRQPAQKGDLEVGIYGIVVPPNIK